MWVGGMAGGFVPTEVLDETPAIKSLAQNFTDFQNSPYRGEWDQKTTMTFGEMQKLLIEIAGLYRQLGKTRP